MKGGWGINYDLVRPCDSCPFRTDRKPFLHQERALEISEATTFTCHKTVDYSNDDCDDDGEPTDGQCGPDAQHCAGFLIMKEHEQNQNQMMQIAERLGFYDPSKLDMNSPVFTSREAFVNAHAREYRPKRKDNGCKKD